MAYAAFAFNLACYLTGAVIAWFATYRWFAWKCNYLERRGADRYFEWRERIEAELKKSQGTDRYAALLEDDKTEGYISGLQMALELAADVQADTRKEKDEQVRS